MHVAFLFFYTLSKANTTFVFLIASYTIMLIFCVSGLNLFAQCSLVLWNLNNIQFFHPLAHFYFPPSRQAVNSNQWLFTACKTMVAIPSRWDSGWICINAQLWGKASESESSEAGHYTGVNSTRTSWLIRKLRFIQGKRKDCSFRMMAHVIKGNYFRMSRFVRSQETTSHVANCWSLLQFAVSLMWRVGLSTIWTPSR